MSAAFLAARHGKVMELRWNLNRNGGQAGKSTSIKVSVQKIADEDPRFPTPNIAGNTGSGLDVQKLAADARILAEKWPLFEPGQPIWVTCAGFNKNGDPVSKNVRSGEPNDSADGLSVEAPVEWLKELKDWIELTINLKVNFDRLADAGAAVAFPVRSYIIEGPLYTLHETFELVEPVTITPGSSLTLHHMIITAVSLPSGIGGQRNIPPHVMGKVLWGNGAFKIDLVKPAKNIRFGLGSILRNLCWITYRDEENHEIETRSSPPYGSGITVFEQFTSPEPRRIKTIFIENRGDQTGIDFDNFTMNF